MKIEEIITISGKPGLYQIISRSNNGLIAESLEDKKRFPVFASENVSAFSDISIYTSEDSVPLKDVFKKIHKKEKGGPAIDSNTDPNTLKAYMGEILPNYDKDSVYVSHIKKLVKWYNLLEKIGVIQELIKEEKEDTKKENKPITKEEKITEETENKKEKDDETSD
jgi:hypothetical protein